MFLRLHLYSKIFLTVFLSSTINKLIIIIIIIIIITTTIIIIIII